MKQNDSPEITHTFRDSENEVLSLASNGPYGEPNTIRVYVKTEQGNLVVNSTNVTVEDANSGTISYDLTQDDTGFVGAYDIEWEADFGTVDGRNLVLTSPPTGYQKINVDRKLGTVNASTIESDTLQGPVDANNQDITNLDVLEANVGEFGKIRDRSSGTEIDIDSLVSSFSSVSDDTTEVSAGAPDLNFGTDLTATNDGDGSVTINSTASSGGSLDVTDGTTTITAPSELTVAGSGATSVTVSDDGDGTGTVDVSSTDTDTHTSVSDDGSTVVSDVTDINFAANVSTSNDGDGSVTVSATGGSGSNPLDDRLAGFLVVASDSMTTYETVDPGSYASPLTEAFNRTSSGESVYVGLPMGNFTDTGLSTDTTSSYSGVVEGFGMGKATHFSSKVTFTGTNPGIRPDGFQADNLIFRDFSAHGNGDDHPFVEFDSVNDATNPRNTNFVNIWVQDFFPSGGEGVFDFKNTHAFSNVFRNIMTGDHSGPLFRFNNDDPFMTRLDNVYGDGNNSGTRYPVIKINSRSPVMEIYNLNIGGGYDQIIDGAHFQPGDIRLMSCNYEPRSLTSAGDLVDLTGGGSLTTGSIHVTAASGLTDVDSVVRIDSSAGKRTIGPIKGIGSPIYNNGKVHITGDPGGDKTPVFFGDASEVQNDSGAGNVAFAMYDAGNANV